jgi:hypothetical protein
MNRHDLQKLAEAYTNVHEKKDSSYLETDMKKRQENNEKARKDMAKVKGQKNPHFESVEVEEEKKELPKSKMFRKAGNLGREVVSPSVSDDQRQKAYDRSKKIVKTLNKENQKEEVDSLTAAYNAVYEVEEAEQRMKAKGSDKKMKVMPDAGPAYIKKPKDYVKNEETETVAEDDKSYDRNRKRAAQRAADRNAARAAGKTGVVPGVGYVTARKEKETYVDSAGTTRHKSGAKNEEYEVEGFIPIDKEKQSKIDRQIGRAADKESIEQGKSKKYGRDEKQIEKQYQRQQAMRFSKKMKKEELEATGKFTAEEIEAIINVDIEEGKGGAAAGGAVGNIAGKLVGGAVGGGVGSKIGGAVGAGTGAAIGAKKGRKGSAAVAGAGGSLVAGTVGAATGGAIASSYELEGNPIHEVFKDDIQQFAVSEIAGALSSLASQGAKAVKGLGAMGGETGAKIAQGTIDTVKSGVKFAKKNPLAATAIGAGTAGAGALAVNQMNKNN